MNVSFIDQRSRWSNWSTLKWTNREVVVAQLVELSLPIPEIRCSNPVIGKNLYIYNICLLSTVYWKDENKEKGGGDCPFKKNYDQLRIDHLLTNNSIDQLFIQFFILGMSKEASEHRFREWHIDNEICICNSYLWINKCKIFVTTAL